MPRIHEALSGHRIEYPDPDPKLDKFLKRAQALVEDKRATENDLVALLYGRENPILDPTLFPERGAVTADVLKNPVYHVLSDLLARKRANLEGQTAEQLGKRYTLTVAQAAGELGVTEDAINRGIRERRVPSWVKSGQRFLDPRTFPALKLGQRGPIPASTGPLDFNAGYDSEAGVYLRIKTPEGERPADKSHPADDDEIHRWRRVGVLTGGHGKIRFVVLEPATQEAEIKFHSFYVRGKFRVAGKLNNVKEARKAWESFDAL
jgi:hypothetical protein